MLKRWRQTVTATDLVVWAIGLTIGISVIYGSIQTIRAAEYSTQQWINLTIDGLKLGEIYALIALGYTLVYGILRMINFAHSEIFMSGPFTAVFLAKYLNSIGLSGAAQEDLGLMEKTIRNSAITTKQEYFFIFLPP